MGGRHRHEDIPRHDGCGERLRFVDEDRSADEPHTLTIVRGRDVPDTFEEIFSCAPCGEALNQHFATDPPTLKVNASARLDWTHREIRC